MKIAVIGDGGWGTTLAILLNNKKYNVNLWSVSAGYAEYLDKKRFNPKFLPGIRIPKGIAITSDLKDAVSGADIILLAAPSQYMRSVLEKLNSIKIPKSAAFLSVSKGIEHKTLMTMSEVIKDVLGNVKTAVLSGPTISREVSRNMPAAVVAASNDIELAKKIQRVFTTKTFRVYTSKDIKGVELGGSIKNVVAIAAGILDGLSLGANTKAGLVTRGLSEIARLGVRMGAKRGTFYGISGLGDLVTTCISKYGRNRSFGEQIGKGKKAKDILKNTEMVIEGFATTESAYRLAKKYKVEMPITEQAYAVLYKGKSPQKAIQGLMSRPLKLED